MFRLLAGVMLGAALYLSGAAMAWSAEEWPQFRGPTGQGHAAATGLPVEWGPQTNVAWRQEIPGSGWSSPVVSGGKIFVTSAIPAEDREQVLFLSALCVDAADGAILWRSDVFEQDLTSSPNIHGKNSHASPTPIVSGGRLYVHFGHQGTACLDSQGKVLWRNREVQYAPVHGNGGSPVLVDGKLIFSCDGASDPFVVALDARDGHVVWRTQRDTQAARMFSFSTPLVIEVDGARQVVSPGSDVVCAYDPADGREIWRVRYSGYSVIPRPVYAGGLVLVCTGYDSPGLLAIRPDGKGDVTDTHVAWSFKRGVPHCPSLLAVGQELYMVSDRGAATCLDLASGEVHWQQRVGGNFSASPLYAQGRIYLQSEDGEGIVLAAGRKFEVLQRNPLGERTLASYAVADGALLVRSEKHLYRFQQQ